MAARVNDSRSSTAAIQEPVERLSQDVVGDLSCVQVNLVEKHVVELSTNRVGRLPVQLLRIVEQVERRPDQGRSGFQLRLLLR